MSIKLLTFVDNTAPQCDAEWLNSAKGEVNNLIASTGEPLTVSDLNQVGSAITEYSAGADFYTDGGIADAYVLTVIGLKKPVKKYFNGMRIRFLPGNANTGASTINVSGIGNKNIKLADGSTNPSAGNIPVGTEITLTYDGANFRITGRADAAISAPVVVSPSDSKVNYAVATGTGNEYDATYTPAVTTYEAGLMLSFQANFLSTGAVTLNANGLGDIAIKKEGFWDLTPYDIKKDQIIHVRHDGTQFQIVNTLGEATGTVSAWLSSTIPPGKLLLDGSSSIGNDASTATFKGDEFEGLFRALWDNTDDAEVPVSGGGRGGSAAADFGANKTLQLPNGANVSLFGVGSPLTKFAKADGAVEGVPAGTISASTGGTSTSIAQTAAHIHVIDVDTIDSDPFVGELSAEFGALNSTKNTNSTGGGSSHSHTVSAAFSGSTMDILNPVFGCFFVIKI